MLINYKLTLLITCLSFSILGRSVYRIKKSKLPSLTAYLNKNKEEKYCRSDSHWLYKPLFKTFNERYFFKHLLPNNYIPSLKNPFPTSTQELKDQIEGLLLEVKAKKKKYTNFTLLQNKDFNPAYGNGLLILKFNDYPYVLKLFIETPKSFICPWNKGREQIFLFYLGGGINRHLSGLTRIKNLYAVRKKIKKHKLWKNRIVTPNKWHWIPKNPEWIHLKGVDIGPLKKASTRIPATYGIIADYIENNGSFSLSNNLHRKIALKLCNDLNMIIDPHITNFFIDKKNKQIAIVDTEHFPTIVGIKENVKFNNYIEWYLYLAGKCLKDLYFRTKVERLELQKN